MTVLDYTTLSKSRQYAFRAGIFGATGANNSDRDLHRMCLEIKTFDVSELEELPSFKRMAELLGFERSAGYAIGTYLMACEQNHNEART